MPAGTNERQLSSDAATGIQNGIAISIALLTTALGVIAWFPDLAERWLGRPLPALVKTFPAFAVITLILYFVQTGRQCSVYLTPHGLRIVRGKTEIQVPMNQVQMVERQLVTTQGTRSRTNTVIITLRETTPLGSSIRFVAPMLHAQSVVEDLRRRAGFQSSGDHF